MSDKRYISATDTAKMLRRALKSEFPGVKFSVRTSKYAGGASIDIRWTDGPTEAQVKRIADLYQGATFDGMRDLKEYRSTVLVSDDGPEEVHFGADFVFEKRTHSPEFLGRLESWAEPNGLVRMPQRGACGHWLPEGDCYTAPTDGVGFVCSPECGAKVSARYVDARELPVGGA